ncbi:MAG: DUF1552 domain-containing protein [Cellvibrio sp.]|uniref:DUF1552 domain-containing protein n=1 Tax=Cellvibrio sp. TaxID=1965322 RepID=UPI00272863C4|nr:DUF1552 domain-containing protein [Cellvibrio sp.]
MKKIDSRFRHLPEEDALEAMEHHKKLEEAPAAYNAYLKADYYGEKKDRDQFVQQDRRRFLDLIGKSGIAAGLLKGSALVGGILANRHALAQTAVNKRVVFCYLNSGAASGQWMPTSASQMNQITRAYGPQGYAVSDICHFRQIDVITGGHQTALNSLGVTDYSSPTMDKRIAAVLGTSTPRASIYLGAKATTSGTLCSNIGPCQDSPTQALASIFSGTGGGGGGTTPDTTYALSYDAQLRALDSIKAKLSTQEYARYQEHIDSLKKIKTNTANANSSSSSPNTTNCGSTITPSMANMQATGKSQADIIVAALACGITKVATLQLGNHQGDWLGHNTSWTQDAHQACHGSPSNAAFIEMWRYLNDVPAYLIDKLRKTSGPDGQPLINSTVVVQVTCMGNGMDHSSGNAPFIVATQMPGFASGYSARSGGNIYDLNGAIPKGMGLTGINLGTSTLGLV